MSDGEIEVEVHRQSESSAPRGNDSVSFLPEDAVHLFTSSLDSALEKQKKAIFAEIENRFKPQLTELYTSKSTPKFRYEGNQKQFDFNSERRSEIINAIDFLKRGSVSSARALLEKANEAIKERNKVLRIADKYGWDTAEEYVDDPITDGADDATKLRQAEYRAKMKRKDKLRDRFNPYNNASSALRQNQLFRDVGASYSNQASKSTAYSNYGPPRVYSQSDYYASGGGAQKSGSSRCYYCNEEGHWAYYCPRRTRSTSTGTSTPGQFRK